MTDITEAQAIATLAKHSWNVFSATDFNETMGTIKPNTPLTISYSFFADRLPYYDNFWLQKKGVERELK